MKKSSILIASLIFFANISFASLLQTKPDVKPDPKAKTVKKPVKKTDKKEVKKVPPRKTVTDKPVTNTGTTTK